MISTPEQRNPCSIGIDVGKLVDSSAICVSEVIQIHKGKYRQCEIIPGHLDRNGQWVAPIDAEPVLVSEYFIRHITRLPLGTSYPNVATHITNLLCSPLLAHRDVRVLLDSTGVGQGVLDLLKDEIVLRKEARHAQLKPITFTHGEKYNRRTGALGKAYLVSRLQSLLQSGRVHAPDTAEVNAMLEELRVFEIKVDENGKDTYGAAGTHHDDLAVAAALSVLEDAYAERVTYSTNRIY